MVLLVPWLTDVSSSQRWVIYSQTNGAVSNYTYLFRFVWFVVVFSDLLFCFRICHCVFWLVIMFSGLLLCFLNCYFVFYICICVCNLLFCFQNRDLFCTSRPPYPYHLLHWNSGAQKQGMQYMQYIVAPHIRGRHFAKVILWKSSLIKRYK